MTDILINSFFNALWEAIGAVWWMVPAILLLVFLKSPLFKGWSGEKAVQSTVGGSLNPEIYYQFNNLIIPTKNSTTQIDHVYVSPYGIFVLETKNYSGWIFGNPQQAKWTQVLYKQKHSFQNPLRQNYGHIKALSDLLNLPEQKFHSLIVFLGGCTFKTSMPKNVCHLRQASAYIRSFQTAVLSEEETEHAVAILSSETFAADYQKSQVHKKNIRQKHKRL